jgi:hypothetical protein
MNGRFGTIDTPKLRLFSFVRLFSQSLCDFGFLYFLFSFLLGSHDMVRLSATSVPVSLSTPGDFSRHSMYTVWESGSGKHGKAKEKRNRASNE